MAFKIYFLINIIYLLLSLSPEPVYTEDRKVTEVLFFYSQTCGHCKKQEPYMRYIDANNRNITVKFYDIHRDTGIWELIKEKHNLTGSAVPRTIAGNMVFLGFSEKEGPLEYLEAQNSYIGYYNRIIKAIEDEAGGISINYRHGKITWFRWLPLVLLVLLLTGYFHPLVRKGDGKVKKLWFGFLLLLIVISLLVLASQVPESRLQAAASGLPFPLFVFIIALFDGFNPCAFTVFIILLSILAHSSRKNVSLLLGTVFIGVSGIMYFVFIMMIVAAGSVLFSAFGRYISVIMGAGIALFGLLNIKEFWYFKKGPSLTISENDMSKISRKAGAIVRRLNREGEGAGSGAGRIASAVASTAALAALVNLVELGCTAILPAVYMVHLIRLYSTRISFPHVLYTLFYAAVYVIPLIILLIGFRRFFPSRRMTEEQGRVMKLFTGLLLLMVGLLMVFNPAALSF